MTEIASIFEVAAQSTASRRHLWQRSGRARDYLIAIATAPSLT